MTESLAARTGRQARSTIRPDRWRGAFGGHRWRRTVLPSPAVRTWTAARIDALRRQSRGRWQEIVRFELVDDASAWRSVTCGCTSWIRQHDRHLDLAVEQHAIVDLDLQQPSDRDQLPAVRIGPGQRIGVDGLRACQLRRAGRPLQCVLLPTVEVGADATRFTGWRAGPATAPRSPQHAGCGDRWPAWHACASPSFRPGAWQPLSPVPAAMASPSAHGALPGTGQ